MYEQAENREVKSLIIKRTKTVVGANRNRYCKKIEKFFWKST